MSEKKVFDFTGKAMTVHWDKRLCVHVGECGQSEGELFVSGRDPWCIPDNATTAEVAEICERCPSGALTYTGASGDTERADGTNTVHVAYKGPLYVKGELAIEDAPDDMPGVRYRAALCRCGQSKNKPFCDNSHIEKGFDDFGAIGEKGPGVGAASGKLNITPLKDGPLVLSGGVILTAGSGRQAWSGEKVALCRCGESNNKPFCDGSHKSAGFRSD